MPEYLLFNGISCWRKDTVKCITQHRTVSDSVESLVFRRLVPLIASQYKISKAWQLLWMTLESQDQSRCTTVLLWPKSRFLRVVAG